MNYKQKLEYQSNQWYNDGLKKANIRDLSGAIASLKKSLQYNGNNTPARNLLGLVYFGRGDIVEALVEWILSKNLRAHENIADYYIDKVQKARDELEDANNCIKKYNLALNYVNQGSEDLAMLQLQKVVSKQPTFVKAHQLLALLYLQGEQYKKAKALLKRASKLDKTDPITLELMHELHLIGRKRTARLKEQEIAENSGKHAVEYKVGNETIIQPAATSYKEHGRRFDWLNIAIGMLIAFLIMIFLVLPQVSKSNSAKNNKEVVGFSEQLETQKAQIAAMKEELEKYRATETTSEGTDSVTASVKDSYEIVLSINKHFTAEDMSDKDMVAELVKVDVNSLGEAARAMYDTVTATVYPRYSESLYNEGANAYEVANYELAKTDFELIEKISPGYKDGNSMLFLAKTYEKLGEADKAKSLMAKIAKDYSNLDTGDVQNTQNSQ